MSKEFVARVRELIPLYDPELYDPEAEPALLDTECVNQLTLSRQLPLFRSGLVKSAAVAAEATACCALAEALLQSRHVVWIFVAGVWVARVVGGIMAGWLSAFAALAVLYLVVGLPGVDWKFGAAVCLLAVASAPTTRHALPLGHRFGLWGRDRPALWWRMALAASSYIGSVFHRLGPIAIRRWRRGSGDIQFPQPLI